MESVYFKGLAVVTVYQFICKNVNIPTLGMLFCSFSLHGEIKNKKPTTITVNAE